MPRRSARPFAPPIAPLSVEDRTALPHAAPPARCPGFGRNPDARPKSGRNPDIFTPIGG